MKNWSKKEKWMGVWLCIIYLVGIVGIALPLHRDFVRLTPLNLCVSLLIVLLCQKEWSWKLIILLGINYFIGFFAEVYGVNKGILFGGFYKYGDAMGWQLFQTPLTAGFLWVIVATGVVALLNRSFEASSWLIKSFFGAFILVSLDVLIEPVAIKLDFWRWQEGIVPFQNYVGWYGVGFLILALYFYFLPKYENRLATLLLFLQFVFFGVFNVLK
jgi:bisanhydrobacterioruberin hydratase